MMCNCTVIIKADIIKGLSYCYYANGRDQHYYIKSVAGVLTFSDKIHLLSLKVAEAPLNSVHGKFISTETPSAAL